ncbi:hypothetical protein D0N87_08080 [Pseudomonas sp. ATCC 13867]|nr:hypothetical protein D0N87_08080 [Pseudomonas sp. ATCC 13867]
MFRPPRASHFLKRQKVTKGLGPIIRVPLRGTDSLRSPFGPACGCYYATLRFPRSIEVSGARTRRSPTKGHPWPIAALGFGFLRRSTSCIHAVVAASMPLNP